MPLERAVWPFVGPSFAEAGVPFGQLSLTEDKLHELDATGWELCNLGQASLKQCFFVT
jgi:arylsulfatase